MHNRIVSWLSRQRAEGKIIRLVLPLLVLASCVVLAIAIQKNQPQVNKVQNKTPPVLKVFTLTLTPVDYSVKVKSYGTIKPRNQSTLVSQIKGLITYASPAFVEGGFFEQGDILLKVDDRDYQVAKKIAEAALVEAKLVLLEEKARAVQAKKDWSRLGKGGKANELVLRKPQLSAANAAVSSAKARLEQTKLDLERTQVKAPYAGRLLAKQVDFGQFVNSGTQLADIYAIDYVELRIPLNSAQQAVIELPEQFRSQAQPGSRPKVIVAAKFGRQEFSWQGELVRAEGALDRDSRQLFAVARIEDPYGRNNESKPSLKIGQFVSATIQGKQLSQVFVIPQAAVYQGNQVILLTDGLLTRRKVQTIWRDASAYIVDRGVVAGEVLVTTPLGNVMSGTRAQVIRKEEPY